MTTNGTVRSWTAADGWGVIDSPETPGGCWTHFSYVVMAGYHVISPGHPVRLDWESADQDGYRFRAIAVSPA